LLIILDVLKQTIDKNIFYFVILVDILV